MKLISVVFLFFLIIGSARAQSPAGNTEFIPSGIRQYQFALPKQGAEIKDLQYVPSGEPVKGTLSPDGNRVILENYRKGSRVKMNVNYTDGTSEELIKSPCFIDPVSYEL
jgi:hypothetical protein